MIVGKYYGEMKQHKEVRISAAGLFRYARKSRNSSAGVDGWCGRHWAALPEVAFEPLARIWNLALELWPVPEIWRNIRTDMIPKDATGSRPILAAALGWRCGIGIIISQLAGWIDQRAPEQLVGGLPGRDARTIHEGLHQQIRDALDGGVPLDGAKRDMEKCFDSGHAQLAIKGIRARWGTDGYDQHPD